MRIIALLPTALIDDCSVVRTVIEKVWSDDKEKLDMVWKGYQQCMYDNDGLYYLILHNARDVGILGWYPYGDSTVGLRWSGIDKGCRGNGYFKEAFGAFINTLPDNIKHITNVTPSDSVAEYFIKVLGFKLSEDVNICVPAVREAYCSEDYKNFYVLVLPIRQE